jgi:7-cyano-7-deazaguanine synthase
MTKKAVILLSGGIDSSTTAAIARSEGYELYALSFDYGQRHKIELESAKKVAEYLGAKKHLIINFDLREIGGSALTAAIEVPKNRAQKTNRLKAEKISSKARKIKSAEGFKEENFPYNLTSELPGFCTSALSSDIPVTYVPARNTIFLSFGLSWAEVLEAPDIFIGANAIDYSGYPDCRPEYLKAFEEMANLATKISVEGEIRFKINAPLLYLTKADIIKKGMELGFDYGVTWSCYDPQKDRNALKQNTHHASRITHHGFIPCGKCDSCIFRAKGFKEAGVKDPLL